MSSFSLEGTEYRLTAHLSGQLSSRLNQPLGCLLNRPSPILQTRTSGIGEGRDLGAAASGQGRLALGTGVIFLGTSDKLVKDYLGLPPSQSPRGARNGSILGEPGLMDVWEGGQPPGGTIPGDREIPYIPVKEEGKGAGL